MTQNTFGTNLMNSNAPGQIRSKQKQKTQAPAKAAITAMELELENAESQKHGCFEEIITNGTNQKQAQLTMQVSKELVLQREMFLREIDNCLNIIANLYEIVHNAGASQEAKIAMNSLVSTALNTFAMSCDELWNKKKDRQAIVLGNEKLVKYCSQLDQNEYDTMRSQFKFMQCCLSNKIDPEKNMIGLAVNEHASGKYFTEKNVSDGIGSWLQANHNINDKIKDCSDNYLKYNSQHGQIYHKSGGQLRQLDSDSSIPNTQDIYYLSANTSASVNKRVEFRDFNNPQPCDSDLFN